MIWLASDRRAQLRALSGDPALAHLRAAAASASADRAAEAAALLAVLDGDAAAAVRAYDLMTAAMREGSNNDLGLGALSLRAAAVWDACHPLWDAAQRGAYALACAGLIDAAKDIRTGNPHVVTNNWWAITHSGMLLCALVARAGGVDRDEDLHFAWSRLNGFLQHVGDAGIYHEGLGYQSYTCSHLLPALLAGRAAGLGDPVAACPGLTRMAATFALSGCQRPALSDAAAEVDQDGKPTAAWGAMLLWNDAGTGWPQQGTFLAMLAFAPAADQGALRDWYDTMTGHRSHERDAGSLWIGWHLALAYYPFAHAARPMDLPRLARDARQGMYLARSAWDGRDACIVGVYAKATWGGGHAQEDAGSVRCMALGHDWMMGGGQNRGKAAWQSIAIPDPDDAGKPRHDPKGLGAILGDACGDGRLRVGMELRKVSGAYHERYVAAHWPTADAPFALAILDLIDEHRAGVGWSWHASQERDMAVEIHPDGQGVTCRPTGSNVVGTWRFLGARPATITVERMPDAKRTYASGQTVAYPGRSYLRVRYDHAPSTAILAVLTVTRGAGVAAAGDAQRLTLGSAAWSRPFGALIPPAMCLATARGLCRHPRASA